MNCTMQVMYALCKKCHNKYNNKVMVLIIIGKKTDTNVTTTKIFDIEVPTREI